MSIPVTTSEATLTYPATIRKDSTGVLTKHPSGKLKAAIFGSRVAGTQSAEDLQSVLRQNAAD
ncbi:hypothetical protein HPB50_029345 [Hyalomma asiaticum]|nr:hypothetical protein HPB50_029345 [Hyalomma asiaticum]